MSDPLKGAEIELRVIMAGVAQGAPRHWEPIAMLGWLQQNVTRRTINHLLFEHPIAKPVTDDKQTET